jgi:hypothetical protein
LPRAGDGTYAGAPMSTRWLCCALASSLALGCTSDPQTCKLPTSEIVMSASVSDVNGDIEVDVEFQALDGSTTLELCPGRDRLTVNGVAVESIRVFGEQYYRVGFEDPAERYEIHLGRNDASDATVAIDMPPSFEITAPAPNSSYSRSGTLTVEWAPSWIGEVMQLSLLDDIGSSCIDGLGLFDTVEDVGQVEIGGTKLAASEADLECDLTLLLTRSSALEFTSGTLGGGGITASISRGFTIRSLP